MEFPSARSESLVVQDLADEVLICDTNTFRMFCLNKTAAEVWKLCDGKRDIKQIAGQLSKKLGAPVSDELIFLTLDQLSADNLLKEEIRPPAALANLSRREVIRRVGLASLIALPIISSLVMPTAAMAQSSCPPPSFGGNLALGCECNVRFDCDSNCCDNDVCAPTNTGSCLQNLGAACASNADCTGGLQCCAPSNPVCSFGC